LRLDPIDYELSWRPLRGELIIDGIEAEKPGTRGSVQARELRIGYRLLGLLRGKLVVDALEIKGVKLSLPERATREKPASRKRIKLGRLLLLKNLEIEQAVVDGLGISFGESSAFSADQVRISLVPSFFGDTKLSIRTDGMLLSKGERPILSAGLFSLKASTDIARWGELFPYLNAVDGVVRISDANLEGLSAESFSASAALSDGLLKLSELKVLIGGNPLEGWLTADASTGSFDLGVDIPKPISLPHFWRPMQTMDLGGELSGRVRLEGKGFVPSESAGQGRAELTHRFSTHPERPVGAEADLSWSEGVVRVSKAEISSGDVEVSASGQVDMARRHFKFDAKGSGFPLEDLFLEFTNPYLQRIFGPTDFTGSIEGWGKAFKARVTGTTVGGGWKPITAQRVESEFEATYDDLKLVGKIFSGSRQTGSADLKIRFGPKIGDADRSKFIELTASLSDHPAEDSLGAYGLSGIGNGTIKLTGPHTAFKGESIARIERGSLYGIEFDLAKAELSIGPKGILFSGMELKLPSLSDAEITGTLAGDTGGGAIRLHGTPAEGLSIDATYRGADSRWTIKEISWSDPERPGNRVAATGSVSTLSGMDLKLSGRVDLGALSLAAPLMREGSGPVDLDLAVRGTTADPRMFGSLSFNENTFSPRGARLSMERVSGALRFEGHRVRFDGVRAVIDDGELRLGGTLDMRGLSPAAADMTIAGSAMRYRNEDSTLSMEIDGSLSMTGAFPSPLLKGDVTVLDGRYTRDFTILDAMTAGSDRAKRPKKDFLSEFDPRLDIRARN
ncbi:MAG TPA: hypothetical protein PLY45_02530, partial [bacterium]|nr:hypothetical protein [bacterium]